MIRVTRAAATAAALLALAAVSPGPAFAQAPPGEPSTTLASRYGDLRLPEGWKVTGAGAGRQLVWTSPEPVPMGDARVEFQAGDRLLGHPTAQPDGRTFRLPLGAIRLDEGTRLRVTAGGRPLGGVAPSGAARLRPATPATPATPTTPAAPAAPAALPEAPLPVNAVDPGKPGRYRTVKGSYDLASVRLPGYPEPIEMRATVVGPADAPGKRPVALFLHGRHATCYAPGTDEMNGSWPCAAGTRPVPSHEGYLRAQRLLASQGYVTLSISANGINGQDFRAEDAGAQARSSLVRLHLARWAEWSAHRAGAPAAVRATSPADLSRVLLVGHSRGGEGVNRAAVDSLTPPPAGEDGYRGPVRWTIRGTVPIGPTIFGRNPAPDVPSMTILPGCDGDVSDLQGQNFVDGTRGVSRGSALHSAVYMVGANHNYFNSEWTPGQAKAPAFDDFSSEDGIDPVCSPGAATRLTATRQQAAGATYIAAAARLFVGGDDTVRPLLDGTGRRAPSAGPVRVLAHAVGGNRTPAFLPDSAVTASGAGRICAQVDTDATRSCLSPEESGRSPHFASWEASTEPGRDAVALQWANPGSRATVRSARPVSLAGSDALALRLIVPPNSTGTTLDVAVTDASGRRASLGRTRVDGLPGTERTASYWAREVRVPLTPAARSGLDLKRVTSLDLTPGGGTGRAWLMDAWGWRPGTPAARPAALTRVDLGRLTVKEGDAGVRTYRVPVQVSGRGSGQVRLFLPDPDTGAVASRTVTVRPGRHDLDIPIEVRGNTRYGYDLWHTAFVKAVRGTVVGSHRGGVTALNDDTMPTVTLTPVADDVTEGSSLTWRVSLSTAADIDVFGNVSFLPVTTGTELSTADVDPAWLERQLGHVPDPVVSLSEAAASSGLALGVNIPAGQTSTEVTVPTVRDALAEPAESLRAALTTYDGSWEPVPGPEFTGTVREAP
ncbi:alpha/beta hydrolase family protein [Streptomyces sp. LMG1-1-1.1]|uniref:alpha/beta hydrolase family protein n=1 Tax=Streptomyces sp. LMG1-1-1.1 TaxID=3135245 RepID=UPI003467AA82